MFQTAGSSSLCVLNLLRQRFKTENNVTCPLKAKIAESEKMSVARQWLFKHVSTAAKSRYRCNNEHATM
jgi:hypothetical protein